MARRADKMPITAAMYRHFAAVTLVCTLALAIFSDGENREAVAREVAEPAKFANDATPTDFVRKDNRAHGSFGADNEFDGSFGQPMDSDGAAAHDGVIPGEPANQPGSGMPVGYTIYGVSSDVWASLTDEQKKRLIASQQAATKAAEHSDRAEQIDSLLAASRARSGSSTPGD